MASEPRILLIDSYDSFTHNLAHLIRRSIPGSQIYLIRNDDLTYRALLPLLPFFSAVIVGPGPGSPANDADVGVIKKLWNLPESHILPVFGVCLGFQSLVCAFGGSLRTMQVVKHGMISHIEHHGNDLFEGVGYVEATRYHSLCVDLKGELSRSEMDALAWTDDGKDNQRVLMAARHRIKPFWGVQYHPESICTQTGGEVIRNFWRLASKWTCCNDRDVPDLPEWTFQVLGEPWLHTRPTIAPASPSHGSGSSISISYVSIDVPHLSIQRICESLGPNSPESNFVLLESAAKPGRFTIVGSPMASTLSIRYTLPESYVTLQRGNLTPHKEYFPKGCTIWDWLGAFMASHKVSSPGHEDVPFWGGLVGYLSYELGVAELRVPLKHRLPGTKNADVSLIFVERSIIIDNETGRVHVQSLVPNDRRWLENTASQLKSEMIHSVQPLDPRIALHSRLTSPSQEAYVRKVKQCKDHLSVGSSYELCLTGRSTLHISGAREHSPWELYKLLRSSNPAPYAAFLRLDATNLLCSSPERFLKWDRSGKCELRPIKGTLRKEVSNKNAKKRSVTREDADKLLGRNIKERAENLMIVDLVRHDLGGVVDAADGVEVTQLMGIEEYETMWQMVSAISGKVSTASGGWEVLRRSLPPGSMTGAPKKRSVELLQDLEGQERGVYSGVCGYWCVGGSGDWSVIIRSCFRHDGNEGVPVVNGEVQVECGHDGNDNKDAFEQCWSLGAGGAITALSDPVAEWEEMRVKLGSVGRAFGVDEL